MLPKRCRRQRGRHTDKGARGRTRKANTVATPVSPQFGNDGLRSQVRSRRMQPRASLPHDGPNVRQPRLGLPGYGLKDEEPAHGEVCRLVLAGQRARTSCDAPRLSAFDESAPLPSPRTVWIQRSSEHLLNPHLISGQLRANGAHDRDRCVTEGLQRCRSPGSGPRLFCDFGQMPTIYAWPSHDGLTLLSGRTRWIGHRPCEAASAFRSTTS